MFTGQVIEPAVEDCRLKSVLKHNLYFAFTGQVIEAALDEVLDYFLEGTLIFFVYRPAPTRGEDCSRCPHHERESPRPQLRQFGA